MTYRGGDFELRIFCTGRGTHGRRLLGQVVYSPTGQRLGEFRDTFPAEGGGFIGLPLVREPVGERRGQRPFGNAVQPREGGGVRIKCPSCGRDVPMKRERLETLVIGLRDRGVGTLDLSMGLA